MKAILIKTYNGSKTEYPSVSEAKKAADNYLSKFEKSGLPVWAMRYLRHNII